MEHHARSFLPERFGGQQRRVHLAHRLGRRDLDKANVKLNAWIPTLAAQYRLVDKKRVDVHLLGAATYLWLESDIKPTTYGPLETRTAKLSDSGGVSDGIVGFRGQVRLNH